MHIEISVPSLLSDCTNGQVKFSVEAEKLKDALSKMLETYPLLRKHLYNEEGDLRQHVLIYYNSENIVQMERLDITLQPGDRIHVLQAVSGG
ncbi:MAG TPA: MoaD/ThiS family protein [Bacilli bacterium]